MALLRLATAWLGGCSGCHMSFLDLDEFLLDLAGRVEVVYSPLVDAKQYPENVDVVLVEGAVSTTEHLTLARTIRQRTRIVIAFGDCAVTGNVTGLRNPLGKASVVLKRAYEEEDLLKAGTPCAPGVVPPLLDLVTPLHSVLNVDLYLPGCPPPAPRIRKVFDCLLAGEPLRLSGQDLAFG